VKLRGALRTFALGLLVATVVTWGGCLVYLASVREEVRDLRAGLEAEGAPLDVDAFLSRLDLAGDPRVVELLRDCEEAPPGGPEELAGRIAGLGVLEPARQAWWLDEAGQEEGSGMPPVRGYMNLVNVLADGVRERLEAGDAPGAAEELPAVLAAIDLVRPANLVFGMARAGLELHAIWILSDVVAALPPDAPLPPELEPWLEGLDPRGSLDLLLEGERAMALTQLASVREGSLGGVSGIPAGELQLLLTEREYLVQMGRSVDLVRGPWAEAEARQRELEDQRGPVGHFEPRQVAAAMLTPVVGALRAENDVLALRDLALAGLAARRGGAEAARAVLAGRLDPYTDAPYALEVGQDGALRMWSAGADGFAAGPAGWTRALEPSADDLRWIVRAR
jgi:hypothetical protein